MTRLDYERVIDQTCPVCGTVGLVEQVYDSSRWVACGVCDYGEELPLVGPSPMEEAWERTKETLWPGKTREEPS